MSAASHRGLAYTTASRAVPGGHHAQFAVATCRRCPAEQSFRLPRGSNNPEAVQKLFRAEGWQFDSWVPGDTRCPACLAAAAERRRGDKPERGKGTMLQVVTPMGGAPAPEVRPPEKTALTAPDRGRLRVLLDGVFDADKGFYIEAYSDAKVAAELDLPARLVRDYREVAFGPLTSVPELDALAGEVLSLQARSAAQAREAAAIGAQVEALRRRVEETARRLGVTA